MSKVRLVLAAALLPWCVTSAWGVATVVDLTAAYTAVGAVLDTDWNPANSPDQDGDGTLDLEGQANIDQAIAILADDTHASHEDVYNAYVNNKAIGESNLAVLQDAIGTIWGLFMTIEGSGSFQGPTDTGMRGRVEGGWDGLNLDVLVGPFADQAWIRAEFFGGSVPVIPQTGFPFYHEEGSTIAIAISGSVDTGQPIQWSKDGTPLVDGGNVSGSQTQTLTITNLTSADSAAYSATYDDGTKAANTFGPIAILVVPMGALPVAGGAGLAILTAALIAAGARAARRRNVV